MQNGVSIIVQKAATALLQVASGSSKPGLMCLNARMQFQQHMHAMHSAAHPHYKDKLTKEARCCKTQAEQQQAVHKRCNQPELQLLHTYKLVSG